MRRRTFMKAAGALAAALTISSKIDLFKPGRVASATTGSQATVLTCAHDSGPFLATVVNGNWVKTSPLAPNIPVAPTLFLSKNRLNSPTRILYPMMRADFNVNGNRNTQNRGSMNFVRITWEQALDLVASEINRVVTTYGASAIYGFGGSHQWDTNLHTGSTSGAWGSKFFSLLGTGEYTTNDGEGSIPSWSWGGYLSMGGSSGVFYYTGYSTFAMGSWFDNNNLSDLLANCKLLINWSTDPTVKSYTDNVTPMSFEKLKAAGVKIISIDHWQNDTAAVYADKFFSILPGTDEAMMAAIAYVWITQGLYNKSFVASHVVGFDASTMPAGSPANSSFSDYILGTGYDKVSKTPQWAEGICGVEAGTITALALEWASKPTYVLCMNAGANRRPNGVNWVRMIITLQAMLGYLGAPGSGIGGAPATPSPTNMTPPAAMPIATHPSVLAGKLPPRIQHVTFSKAILNPPVTWTYGDLSATYPANGYSQVKMVYFIGGSGYFMNQMSNINEHVQGIQSPNLQIVICQAPWWHALPYYSDVVLPVAHNGERDDITNWNNYSIYMHTVSTPPGEAMNDLDVFRGLATRLGLLNQLTGGLTDSEMLQQLYSQSNIPMTFSQFQQTGYYNWKIPATDTPYVGMQAFNTNPKANPLPTPSGLVEVYSSRVATTYGANDSSAPTIPMYVPEPEGPTSTTAQTYPLQFDGGAHSRRGRHSQWQDVAPQRDLDYDYINGYKSIWINPVDAAARKLKYGDVVRVFNDHGQILCAAKVSERARQGVVWVTEGGHYTPQQPGVVGTIDLGGNTNVLIPGVQISKLSQGQITHTLVEVEKWSQ